ncbi:hypothetical protein BH09BAC1_BH09BAC1_28410 [soil metagenome]
MFPLFHEILMYKTLKALCSVLPTFRADHPQPLLEKRRGAYILTKIQTFLKSDAPSQVQLNPNSDKEGIKKAPTHRSALGPLKSLKAVPRTGIEPAHPCEHPDFRVGTWLPVSTSIGRSCDMGIKKSPNTPKCIGVS